MFVILNRISIIKDSTLKLDTEKTIGGLPKVDNYYSLIWRKIACDHMKD